MEVTALGMGHFNWYVYVSEEAGPHKGGVPDCASLPQFATIQLYIAGLKFRSLDDTGYLGMMLT